MAGQARAALARNLPKVGFTQTDPNTFKTKEGLTVALSDSGWSLLKDGKQSTSGAYGTTQMQDVRKACSKLGVALGKVPKSTGTAPAPSGQKKKGAKAERTTAP